MFDSGDRVPGVNIPKEIHLALADAIASRLDNKEDPEVLITALDTLEKMEPAQLKGYVYAIANLQHENVSFLFPT